jgi:hypothetical protein
MFMPTWIRLEASNDLSANGRARALPFTKAARSERPQRREDELFRQVNPRDVAAMLPGEIARQPADAGSSVEHSHIAGQAKVAPKSDRCRQPAQMKFVSPGESGRRQLVDILSARLQSGENRLLEPLTTIVLCNPLLGIHGRLPRINSLKIIE